MTKETISNKFPFESHYVDVLGSKMHYVEQGQGNPILLLHGMPGSAYVWRNIIPYLSTLGRCIAPDLIGMGKSDKPNIEYSIADHIQYIEKFIETLNLKRITLVLHSWGSIIGLSYAMTHENNCKGLVLYEAYLRPMQGDSISLPLQEQLAELEGEKLDIIKHGSKFIDHVIPSRTMRELSKQEMAHYREPFLTEGSGKPLHQYLLELPGGTDHNKLNTIIKNYSDKLLESWIPKLLLYSLPGFITTIATVMWAKEHFHNLEIADIGEDLHYAQESNPFLMGETISIWLQGIEQTA